MPPDLVKESIVLLNRTRDEFGLEPIKDLPTGCKRADGTACLVYKMLEPFGIRSVAVYDVFTEDKDIASKLAKAWGTFWGDVWQKEYSVALPHAFMQLLDDFDAGKLPQYQ